MTLWVVQVQCQLHLPWLDQGAEPVFARPVPAEGCEGWKRSGSSSGRFLDAR